MTTHDNQLLELLKLCHEIDSLCDSNGHFQHFAYNKLEAYAQNLQADIQVPDLTLREVFQLLDTAKDEFNSLPELSTETVDN